MILPLIKSLSKRMDFDIEKKGNEINCMHQLWEIGSFNIKKNLISFFSSTLFHLCFLLYRSLVSKNEPNRQSSANDNNEDSSTNPLFRKNTFNVSPTTRASVSFTFPLYMEEPIIVYPGAIVCFLQIISCIPRMVDEQVGNLL